LKTPDDIRELLYLIDRGQLFEVQAWIKEGRRIFAPEDDRLRFCPLIRSVNSGFHSMVKILLEGGGWSQQQMDEALDLAMEERRLDLADLLIERGAAVQELRFSQVCGLIEPEVIERFLRAGVDPARDNGFAYALNRFKARPLLRLYRSLREEFPSLHAQASLALADAVASEKSLRWVILLVWAGADPMMRVPSAMQDPWPCDGEYATTAALQACWVQDIQFLRALKLKPTAGQTRDLIEHAAYFPSPEIVGELLSYLPRESLNAGDPPSCRAVEQLVAKSPDVYFSRLIPEKRNQAILNCLELLLQAGGRWSPDPRSIPSVRRSLLKHSSWHVVKVVRLLIQVPDAADPKLLEELCRTPTMRQKIRECDKSLLALMG